MPIYDLGYRGWNGRLVPAAGRFWAITSTGVRLAWQSRFLRRMLLLAGIPVVYAAVLLFVFEKVKSVVDSPETDMRSAPVYYNSLSGWSRRIFPGSAVTYRIWTDTTGGRCSCGSFSAILRGRW